MPSAARGRPSCLLFPSALRSGRGLSSRRSYPLARRTRLCLCTRSRPAWRRNRPGRGSRCRSGTCAPWPWRSALAGAGVVLGGAQAFAHVDAAANVRLAEQGTLLRVLARNLGLVGAQRIADQSAACQKSTDGGRRQTFEISTIQVVVLHCGFLAWLTVGESNSGVHGSRHPGGLNILCRKRPQCQRPCHPVRERALANPHQRSGYAVQCAWRTLKCGSMTGAQNRRLESS